MCIATSGLGAIHLLNGLYDAKMDHQYVVAIVGQTANFSMGSNYQQEVDLRSKKEFTTEILVAIGGISRYKTLLKISDEVLDLADRYITSLSVEYHVKIIRQIINLNLTSKQVQEICETDVAENESPNKYTAFIQY